MSMKKRGGARTRLSLTVKQIRRFRDLWKMKSAQQIADEMGITRTQVAYVAYRIRKAGYELPHKRLNGYWDTLIKEALGE